jgi:glycosyltransferase involved in cell wall biosynthesis
VKKQHTLMHLVFVCLSADPTDHAHVATLSWIDTLASRPEIDRLTVLALRAGAVPPRSKLTVRGFRGRTRLHTLWRFYVEVGRALRGGADAFFVYQTGPYPVLLWPIKMLRGIPVYYWKAHPYISPWTWLSARVVATRVFTATPGSLPLRLSNLVIVGHGIDVQQFSRPDGPLPDRDLITVGRITPVKRLDVMVKAVARCTERFGLPVSLDIYGPTHDDEYRAALMRLIDGLGLSGRIVFRGVTDDLPPALRAHRLFLNFSRTALDKAVLESMACGVPVLSTNPAVAEMLPPALRADLVVPEHDVDAQAAAIHRLLTIGDAERAALGAALRELVVRNHSVQGLFDRIMKEMVRDRQDAKV